MTRWPAIAIGVLVTALAATPLRAQTPTPAITWTASSPTRVAPADAVKILQGNQSIANRTGLGSYPADGQPLVASTGASPTDGPFGPFVPFYASLPDRPLDGSFWSDPPWTAWPSAYGFGAPFVSAFSHVRSFAAGGTGLFTPRRSRARGAPQPVRPTAPVRPAASAPTPPVSTRPAMGGTAPRLARPSRR